MKLVQAIMVLGMTVVLSGCNGATSSIGTDATGTVGGYGGSREPREQARERGEILRRRSGKKTNEFSDKAAEAISRASMQDAMRNADHEESDSIERLQKQAIWACDKLAVEDILDESDIKQELCRLMDKGWGLKDADAILSLMEESGMSEIQAETTIRDFVRDRGLKPSWIER